MMPCALEAIMQTNTVLDLKSPREISIYNQIELWLHNYFYYKLITECIVQAVHYAKLTDIIYNFSKPLSISI
jgi:hypothetical protein